MADCGKKSYRTAEHAQRVVESQKRRGGHLKRKRLSVYQCPQCSQFHLTYSGARV